MNCKWNGARTVSRPAPSQPMCGYELQVPPDALTCPIRGSQPMCGYELQAPHSTSSGAGGESQPMCGYELQAWRYDDRRTVGLSQPMCGYELQEPRLSVPLFLLLLQLMNGKPWQIFRWGLAKWADIKNTLTAYLFSRDRKETWRE